MKLGPKLAMLVVALAALSALLSFVILVIWPPPTYNLVPLQLR